MLKGPFLSRNWMGSNPDYNSSKWVLMGLPFDGTCSYRPGSRFAPEEIRIASWGLEEYSPIADRELENVNFHDAGELEFPIGNAKASLKLIKDNVEALLADNKLFFGIGGEHLVSLPSIEAYASKYPDLAIIHFDAHTDLRESYLGEKLSHASVIKRVSEFISSDKIIQIGIRSGEKNEFEWMKEHNTLVKSTDSLKQKLSTIGNLPIFITLDIDVLDPSIMAGTGTPEAGGMTFNELIGWFKELKELNVVGMDMVELAPHYDKSGVSTAIAAKVIREMLLIFG